MKKILVICLILTSLIGNAGVEYSAPKGGGYAESLRPQATVLLKLAEEDLSKQLPREEALTEETLGEEIGLPGLIESLRGKDVVIINGSSRIGSYIVTKLYEANIGFFKEFIGQLATAELEASMITKDRCKKFLEKGRPIKLHIYETERGSCASLIDHLMSTSLNKYTEELMSPLFSVCDIASKDIMHLRSFMQNSRIKPALIINVSLLRERKILDTDTPARQFGEIAALSYLLRTLERFKCPRLLQIFSYDKFERQGYVFLQERAKRDIVVRSSLVEAQKIMLENIKSANCTACMFDYTTDERDLRVLSQQPGDETVKKAEFKKDNWSEREEVAFFLSGLCISNLPKAEREKMCSLFLLSQLEKDFGIDMQAFMPEARRLENISSDDVYNVIHLFLDKIEAGSPSTISSRYTFSLDSYMAIIGYLFSESKKREELARRIASLWLKQDPLHIFTNSAFKNPYHIVSHTAVRYYCRKGLHRFLYRGKNSVYEPRFIIGKRPKYWDVDINDLAGQDDYTKRAYGAVNKVREYLTRKIIECANSELDDKKQNIAHFKKRKEILDTLTILGIDNGSPFLFTDFEQGIIRTIHIGRSRNALYLPLKLVSEKQLIAWIDYAVNWLAIYHTYHGRTSPRTLELALSHYAESFLSTGKRAFLVTGQDINNFLLSSVGDACVAKARMFHKAYATYREAVDTKKVLLAKFHEGLFLHERNPQVPARNWASLADKFLDTAEILDSLGDTYTPPWAYIGWQDANAHAVAIDIGMLPRDVLTRQMLYFLRTGNYDMCLATFKQIFLGQGFRLLLNTPQGLRYELVDLLTPSDRASEILNHDQLMNLRAAWINNAITLVMNGALSQFEKDVESVCEASSHIASGNKVELAKIYGFKGKMAAWIAYFKDNYETWLTQIEDNESIIQIRDLSQFKNPKKEHIIDARILQAA